MSEEHGNGSFKVSTPLATVEGRGSSTTIMMAMMIALGFGGLGYLLHAHDQRTERLIEAVQVLTYVNALPPERKAELNLPTPRALRDGVRGD